MEPIGKSDMVQVKVGRKNKYLSNCVSAGTTLREFFEMFDVEYRGVTTSINGTPLDENNIDEPIGNFAVYQYNDTFECYFVLIRQPTETF